MLVTGGVRFLEPSPIYLIELNQCYDCLLWRMGTGMCLVPFSELILWLPLKGRDNYMIYDMDLFIFAITMFISKPFNYAAHTLYFWLVKVSAFPLSSVTYDPQVCALCYIL